MPIEEILKLTPDEAVKHLSKKTLQVDIDKARKVLEPSLHDINDPIQRPDKRVKVDRSQDTSAKVVDTNQSDYRIERVARVALAIQKLIIRRAVSFCFGNPVLYNATPDNETKEKVLAAMKKVFHKNKMATLDRKMARTIFSFKECAELWYVKDGEIHLEYGFPTTQKLRCALFSPEKGDRLYPYYDDFGDMVAFSRSFNSEEDGKAVKYFETYTASEYYLWANKGNGFALMDGYPKLNPIGKIPVVYGFQEELETAAIDGLVDRLEKLLSNFADTNDYHASPKIFTTGQILGWAQKGESGAVIQGEPGATMQYVSWQNAPESVKLEIDTLLKLIYTISQTPDISFESVKGIGAISGTALKLLFLDAHLKVQDKKEIFDDYLQRRVNIVKAFLGKMNTGWKEDIPGLDVEPEIVPFMPTNDIDNVNLWLAANGNKPLVSQKASVIAANLTQNPEKDFEELLNETDRDSVFTLTEPTES